jgi:hypothetical protein
MKINIRYHVVLVLVLGLVCINANAALVSRLNGQAVYDTDLNITWLADASLSVSNTFGASGVINPTGTMSWFTAQNWLAAMNAANYLGFSDWRLPTTLYPDENCVALSGGHNCTGSEMGHLFYNELGGAADQAISTTHNANYSLFQNIQANYYWSGTEYTQSPTTPNDNAWRFYFYGGVQLNSDKGDINAVWAVRPGDVAAVPVPTAFWLFGSGLIGLLAFVQRQDNRVKES